jgi:hypothetical protein
MYEAGDMNGRQENRVVLSYRGRELARPNPINLESVRALERQGRTGIVHDQADGLGEPNAWKRRIS